MTDPGRPPCEWGWLDRVTYDRALALQQERVVARQRGAVPDALLLLEHPPVITLGRGADPRNVLVDRTRLESLGVSLFETGRGGDVTYHGPGQVVGYPVMDLNPDRRDVHHYVRDLEEVLLRTAADLGVTGERVDGLTGIWVQGKKLAAIGVRISRWVTSHGFAFNVASELDLFDLIVPCGIHDKEVTSLEDLLGQRPSLPQVAARLAAHFGDVFGREMVRLARETLMEAPSSTPATGSA